MISTNQTFVIQKLLQNHRCYGCLTKAEQKRLLQQSRKLIFQPEETILTEGKEAEFLWWVESGNAKIFKISAEGNEKILHLAGAGESFNDIPVFDEGPNPAHVVALTTTEMWAMPAPLLRTFMLENPRFSQAIIHALAQRVRYFANQIENLTLYGVTARLSRFLLQQAEGNEVLEMGITRKAIAAYLATTPETVSRTLRTLQDIGAIQFDRHQIVIINTELLQSIAML
ncbi:MAG: Crp/Fnr family transcriptional regulator [Anaerolineales bacterium]|nr:Crp/Fnr family transcriptional regulator [Anaerolineales bacterium]